MKGLTHRKIINHLLIAVIGIAVFSCAPTKKAAYLRIDEDIPKMNQPDQVYFMEDSLDDKIQQGDELYVRVQSGEQDAATFQQGGGQTMAALDLVSYVVDREGYIKLPYIERVQIEGLTIDQAIDTIEKQLSQYLYMPTVDIRYINTRVSVLGEVNAPGMYVFNRKEITIYEAIAQAGDITTYGNRTNVMIVRHNSDTIEKKYIDLTNNQLLTSKWYNVQPDDMIYVEPLSRRKWGIETFPYDLLFSAFSSAMLIFTFTLSLYN